MIPLTPKKLFGTRQKCKDIQEAKPSRFMGYIGFRTPGYRKSQNFH